MALLPRYNWVVLTAERQRWYRHRKAVAIYEYLASHPCVDCGEPDPVVLEFDHVRGDKRANVKRMVSGTYSLERVLEEIAKCEVRCANCHRRITARRGGFYDYLKNPAPEPARRPGNRVHNACGTRTGYRRGCRCPPCTEAQKLAARDYKRRMAVAQRDDVRSVRAVEQFGSSLGP